MQPARPIQHVETRRLGKIENRETTTNYETGRLTSLYSYKTTDERRNTITPQKKGYALGQYQRTKLEKSTDEKTAKERERERESVSHILVDVGPIFIPGGRRDVFESEEASDTGRFLDPVYCALSSVGVQRGGTVRANGRLFSLLVS